MSRYGGCSLHDYRLGAETVRRNAQLEPAGREHDGELSACIRELGPQQPPPDAKTRASAIGRLSGSTMRPVTGPATRRGLQRRGERKKGGESVRSRGSFRRVHAPRFVRSEKGRPGVRILARRSLRHPRLPRRVSRPVACPAEARDASEADGGCTSRLQWRHRVGFTPTSHDRRACLADARV